MTSKEDLVNIIKQWIEIDDKLKQLKSHAKEYNNKKKALTTSLLEIMKENEIDCFDINSGKIVYCQSKRRASLNKKKTIRNFRKIF